MRARPVATAAEAPLEVDASSACESEHSLPSANVSRVTVAVRIRPSEGAKTLIRFGPRDEGVLRFTHVDFGKVDEGKTFTYDHVFDQSDSQGDVFRALGHRVIEQVVSGHHASVFAYGQTGSGKTYTMLGTPKERGLIPRLCEALFHEESLKTWHVTMSFFEIYNEQVVDLLTLPESNSSDTERGEESKIWRKEEQREEWLGVGLDPKRKVLGKLPWIVINMLM